MIHSFESNAPHPTRSVLAQPRSSHFEGGPENGVHFTLELFDLPFWILGSPHTDDFDAAIQTECDAGCHRIIEKPCLSMRFSLA
jgi:hypothetical protein